MEPLVSIITPSYNSKDFIGETIESVLNQTYKNWEMIIVDDCSTDSSPELIKEYMKKDSRIEYLKNEKNSGPALTRNRGLDSVKGDYIAFLDSDDIWFKDKLDIQIKFMKEENISILHSNYFFCDENGVETKEVKNDCKVDYKELLKSNQIKTSFLVLEKSVIKDIRFQDMRHEDYGFFLDFLKNSQKKCYCIQQPLGRYRLREKSVSSDKLKSALWTWDIYRKYEKFNLLKCTYYFINYALNGVLKYRKY